MNRQERAIFGWLSPASTYRRGVGYWAMALSTKNVTELLLGTTRSRRATVSLHLVFWLVYAKWFDLAGALEKVQWLLQKSAAIPLGSPR